MTRLKMYYKVAEIISGKGKLCFFPNLGALFGHRNIHVAWMFHQRPDTHIIAECPFC